jgi:putative membrane protein
VQVVSCCVCNKNVYVHNFLRLATFSPLLLHGAAHAHIADRADAPGWNAAPWVVGCLLIALGLYIAGVWKLWRKAGYGRGITVWHAGAFAGGWLTLCLALLSPLDALGSQLFSAHMVQHELLMIVAAPLFVLARPLETWTWGLPYAWRGRASRIARASSMRMVWTALTAPLSAWMIHAAALWGWHVPALFDAALTSEGLHAAQHASFLASALLFWWATVGRVAACRPGLAIALLFSTMLHTGALGALLTFAPTPWYAYEATAAYGLPPLDDQQLGGLIMWIPGGIAYLAAGLLLAYRHYLGAPLHAEWPATVVDQVPRPHRPQ